MSGCHKRRPQTEHNHVGVEFEFDLPSSENWNVLRNELVRSELSFAVEIHREPITWTRTAYEATLLAKETEFELPLRAMLDLLQKYSAVVDNDCGLHVHVDVRNRVSRVAQNRVRDRMGLIWSFCAEQRKTNRHMFPTLAERGYDTFEIRCMEAHFDFDRINRYIHSILDIVNSPA